MRLPYLVQQSEWSAQSGRAEQGFDFGGINGGVAQFMAKGDAILYAQELRRRQPDLAVRVLRRCLTGENMDPQACLKRIDHGMMVRDREEIASACDDLVGWLERGGSKPIFPEGDWRRLLNVRDLKCHLRELRAVAEMICNPRKGNPC